MLTGEFQIVEAMKRKTRIDFSTRVLNFYPTGAVQVNLPFPFVKGRMTVGAEADFQ